MEILQRYFHPPSEFTSTRGDVARLAQAQIDRQVDEAYQDLPGTRSGLTAATVGAGVAAAFLATMETLWALLPGILAALFGVVLLWAASDRRDQVPDRRRLRTRD